MDRQTDRRKEWHIEVGAPPKKYRWNKKLFPWRNRTRKHKKVCATLNYIEHFLILASAITGCISISAFASLLGIPIGIMSSAIELKICVIAAGIKK